MKCNIKIDHTICEFVDHDVEEMSANSYGKTVSIQMPENRNFHKSFGFWEAKFVSVFLCGILKTRKET